MRRPLIAGNWKMHKTVKEALSLVKELRDRIGEPVDRDVLVCPPFTALHAVSKEIKESSILLGAQNMFYELEGAFTGEISPLMLKEVGCSYVILGHSERRRIFKEDDELINRKVLSAVKNGIVPILCVGETLEERERGKVEEVIENQLKKGLDGVEGEFVIAYEPVWAIGTGKTATPFQAQEVHEFVRSVLSEIFGKDFAESVRILYGGSVKPENAKSLLSMPDIDGALVGGASLKADSFSKIVYFDKEA